MIRSDLYSLVLEKKMSIAIYPGTFDPITNGHVDIIKQAAEIFDKVIVTIAVNRNKKPLFSLDDRLNMIRQSIETLHNVEAEAFEGLIVTFANQKKASVLIKGLRAVSDFESELQMALINKKLAGNVVTAFLTPDEKFIYLSSTIIKEVAAYGGDISDLVPLPVAEMVKKKYGK